MSDGGFDADWLALREPVDHASINAELRRSLVDHLKDREQLTIVDIGSGTGSSLRGLAPWFSVDQSWHLIDIDAGLLDIAKTRVPDVGPTLAVTAETLDLKTADFASRLNTLKPDLVTSSAFFDIAPEAIVAKVANACAMSRVAFYTTLTYDGTAAWLPEHDANTDMRAQFNAHQTTDKGMGAALGPAATDALASAFRAHGYAVTSAPSPWVVTAAHRDMRLALDTGWAGAVRETGNVADTLIESWRESRNASDAITLVGHQDLLALPPCQTDSS